MAHRILLSIRQNAIALTALFVSLGGASYAAMKIPAHSVGTKQLRNGGVTSKKLARHSVTASKLDPKSIAGHIVAWAQVSAQGQPIASNPQATVSLKNPSEGLFHVSWQRNLPSSCIAIANPANVGSAQPETANTLGPVTSGQFSDLIVFTFDGHGARVPETFNVVVVCP